MVLNLKLPSDSGGADVSEIEMVESLIDQVVLQINAQSEELLPVAFAFGASVADGSFGGADAAPKLAGDYSRAHEVTWKTLMGVKEDLEAFQQACHRAKQAILDADLTSQDQMRAVTTVLDGVAVHGGRHSEQAHDEARNEAGNRADRRGDR